MSENYGKMMGEVPERALFWGLVVTVVLVVIAMLRGMFAFG